MINNENEKVNRNTLCNFYKNNPKIVDVILDYFKVEKGIKPNIRWNWFYKDNFYPEGYGDYYRACKVIGWVDARQGCVRNRKLW